MATDSMIFIGPPWSILTAGSRKAFRCFGRVFYGGTDRYLTNYVRCLLCWAFCFALLALGQRFFSRKNEFIRYFADASYWVYWVHLPITFYFSMILQSVELNSLFKVYRDRGFNRPDYAHVHAVRQRTRFLGIISVDGANRSRRILS